MEKKEQVWLGRFCLGKLVKVASVPKILFSVYMTASCIFNYYFFILFCFFLFSFLLSIIEASPFLFPCLS